MSLSTLLRHRRLRMPLDPTIGRDLLEGTIPSLKRQTRTAHALAIADSARPSKVPKSSSSMPPSSRRGGHARGGSSGHQSKPSQSGPGPSSSGRRGRGSSKPKVVLRNFGAPLHNSRYIMAKATTPLKPVYQENPKSPLANYYSVHLNTTPDYIAEEGIIEGTRIWRVTVTVPHESKIIGEGDAPIRKDAERLAALSAVIQLNNMGILDSKGSGSARNADEDHKILSDGSQVDFAMARQFMDWYCRRFQFGKEDITWEDVGAKRRGGSGWEAIMTVDGKRIGIGSGANKKAAQIACYLDVVHYLEQCDPALWRDFQEAAKTGKDLGLAPKIYFQMSNQLDDEVRDICHDIKQSTLYLNRPKKTPTQDPSLAANAHRNRRPPPSSTFLERKSETLKTLRAEYAENPTMEKMRNTRTSLPVYTKAEDVLKHIDENEVTICMAATGSGKTTQIPQLILDDWIAKNKGAECNIVCTQPRRLAAISVADRVSKERGEVLGRGSVGYQVRFEQKLPEDHGSITFCTIGIFLKRMQSALLEGGDAGGHNLDDVTHIIVDEVHERDVDTDLLLVVLKRLLADRKARGKPIKVVLMSATIDPSLFQSYFADESGSPAPVIEVPGRSFPVEKHFLDDYLHEISSEKFARQWLTDRDVLRYLQSELDPPTLSSLQLPVDMDARPVDDDSPVPAPLIAMSIAHVLKKSDSGHVLTFLPGWEDIQAVQKFLENSGTALGHDFRDQDKFSIHLLHSTIPLAEQQVIFEPPKPGVRRIILATNIAETSITIPDVVYVVDSGKVKEQRYDPDRHMSSLVSAWVGSSNLNQRAGRAGRHRPGEYYGVLTKRRSEMLRPYQTVEMKRVDLSNVVMHVKALNFPGMSVEDVLAATIEPPAAARVVAAMKDLKIVGALDNDKNLTSLGRVLLQLPIEAQMGRMVLFGSFFRCLDHALTLAAIMTNRDPFVSPMHLKKESSEKKNSWTPTDFRSDLLATLQAYNQWDQMQSNGEYHRANAFCSENFLAKPTLLTIQKVKTHLLRALRQAGVLDISGGGGTTYQAPGRRRDDAVPAELNRNADCMPLLTALIAIASQPNFAIRTGMTYRTPQDKAVFIHPSSVNHRKRDDDHLGLPVEEKQLIAFTEKRQNLSSGATPSQAQKFIIGTTRLDPVAYILFGAYEIQVTDRGLECDDWLPLVGNVDALDDIQRLKYLMEACILRVFEGITFQRHRNRARNMVPLAREEEREDESDDDDDAAVTDYSLSAKEIKDLDRMTTDIVRVLNYYTEERLASQSRHNSRPGTPMSSPMFGMSRLPGRSGTSTPYGTLSAYNSRPGTPGPSPLRKW